MSILYLDTEPVWRGGQEQLLGLMTGMSRRGHRVHLAAPADCPLSGRSSEAGIRVHEFRQRFELSPLAWARLTGMARRGRFDVLHSNTPRTLVGCAVAAPWSGRPARVAARRVIFPLRSRLSRLKYNRSLDAVIAVSQSIRTSLIDQGLPPSKIHVVYEGVDVSWIDSLPPTPLERNEDEVLVGMAAHFSGEKGHRELIEAAFLLKDSHPEARYVLMGDGPLFGSLRDLVSERSLAGRVKFLGFRHDVESLMKDLDIFCLPSHSEGLSSALLASMANRLPIVATRVGGNPELVTDGENGFLAPPRNPPELAKALQRLLDSSELRTRMGEAGRRLVEKQFNLGRKLDATEEIYRELLRSRSIG